MIYKYLIRPLLFLMDGETAHHFSFSMLRVLGKIPGFAFICRLLFQINNSHLEKEVAGLRFKNPVGLAAGFDKDGLAFKELGNFGFGFIEVGTVTPKSQPGNPKPRIFRLVKDKALINRMGFNNRGVEALRLRLQNRPPGLIIGGNIGKNKITPNELATSDYLECFEALYSSVDYFTVNISSPNTPGLRELQEKAPLTALLQAVMALNLSKSVPKPVFLKIAPDLTEYQLDEIISIVKSTHLAGIIVSNTTIAREPLSSDSSTIAAIGAGGLSGAPLKERSTTVLRYIAKKSGKEFAIIASGGIMSAADAEEKLKAGADLIQVYTGFIYEGPALIKRINKHLSRLT